MNTQENTNSENEEHVMKAILNIKEQLNLIKTFYKKKHGNSSVLKEEFEKESNKIDNDIQNLVDSIKDEKNEFSEIDQFTINVKNNDTLLISEKTKKVFLPYTVEDLEAYMNEYPDDYKSLSDVVNQEFIVPFSNFKNQTISRFKATYCLMRDIEMKSIIESFKRAAEIMFNSSLNPMVILACKSEDQLNDYIDCALYKNLDQFKHFKIVFDVAPLSNEVENNVFDSFFEKNRKLRKGRH